MIQRIQSIWLLLAAVFAAITFQFPFYVGDYSLDEIPASVNMDADFNIWIALLTVAAGGAAFINIFFFANRKLQIRISVLGILLSIGVLVLYFMQMQNFTSGSITLWCLFPFGVLGFYILALKGIRKDEKLIRSLDRLR